MPVEMNVDHDDNLLLCRLSGNTEPHELDEMMQEFLRLQAQSGLHRILMDANQRKESMGLVELYEAGLVLTGPDFHGVSLAAFSDQPQPGLEFTRSVVNCRPGANMRTFSDEPSARAWLSMQHSSDTQPV